MMTHFDNGNLTSPDSVERASSRPDFGILCYPVISMGPIGHAISREQFLGPNPTQELIKRYLEQAPDQHRLGILEYLTERMGRLNGLRLTVAGRNLATWTDYTGLDPETVEGGGNVNFSQSEFNTQPPVRYLMIRLDYSF